MYCLALPCTSLHCIVLSSTVLYCTDVAKFLSEGGNQWAETDKQPGVGDIDAHWLDYLPAMAMGPAIEMLQAAM